ncbi:MAG: glycosyltransferase family 4 protein [Helicobacteraceae bacterium]|jgi:N,N'-diacetylbacillosaminyl-diphospho-undecaprenol alpha-1,3-N-acetylgalactosaminyltransferase|nr:glycosyltransferase family 4 protein [Helicobacteraceae bacterium]
MEQNPPKTIVFLSHFDGNLYLFRLPVMRALVKIGWRVIALTPSGEYSGEFAKYGAEHIDYKINRSGLNPFGEAAAIFRLRDVLKKIKPDILHCFAAKPNIYGAIAGKMAGARQIYATVTGLGSFFIDDSLKAGAVKTIILFGYRLIGFFCAKILFQNDDDLRFFTDNGVVKADKALMIGSSGVDIEYWKRSKASAEKHNVVVLFVGRLIAHKGVFELLAAAKNLKQKFGDQIEFVIVGGGDRGNLSNVGEEAFKAYKQIVFFAGEQRFVKPYYDRADIFVLPSYREGAPRAVLEAQSMSLPVVTTDTIGCRDAIENHVTGLLVPVKDSSALEAAIESLFADKALRKTMGDRARLRAEKLFDANLVVKRYLALYNEASATSRANG